MKNITLWKSSKYEYRRGKLRASLNPKEVGIGSRLIADIVAEFYDSHLKHHAQGRLLDLGCGKVPLYASYKDFILRSCCVDWENSLHKNEFLDLVVDLNRPLDLESEKFDTIILSDVLEHIREPKALWAEMYRVMAPRGTLIMNVPFYYWLHEEPHDYYRYTIHALRAMAEDAGFEVRKVEALGGLPEIMADIHSKLAIKIPIIGKPLAILLQKLTWWFVHTSFGKKVSQKSAAKFPLCYGMIAVKNSSN